MAKVTDNRRWAVLRPRLEQLRPLLENQGCLVLLPKRHQRFWYLRYYELTPAGRRHRSIYVGSNDLAERVEELLADFRAPAEFLRETLRLAEHAFRLVKPLLSRHDPRTLSGRPRR